MRLSIKFRYCDFRESLERMARAGVCNNGGNNDGGRWIFYMGPDNGYDRDSHAIKLANITTFLSQAMVTVKLDDSCN